MTHPDVIIRIKHDWSMSLNIAKVDKKRVVIVGGGFGGKTESGSICRKEGL